MSRATEASPGSDVTEDDKNTAAAKEPAEGDRDTGPPAGPLERSARVTVAVAVVVHAGLVLIGRREHAPLAGLAEFPGGKLRAGESPEAGAVREVLEECGIAVAVEQMLARVLADYPHGRLDLRFYLCRLAADTAGTAAPAAPTTTRTSAGEPAASSAALPPISLPPYRWLRLEEMARLEFPPANAEALHALRSLLRDG